MEHCLILVRRSLVQGKSENKEKNLTKKKEDKREFFLTDEDKDVINNWAFQGERIIHGTPSGVDNTVSVHGGVIQFKRGEDVKILNQLPPVKMLITDTKVTRSTKLLVAHVAELKNNFPGVVNPIIAAIDGIAKKLAALIIEIQDLSDPEASSKRFFDTFKFLVDMNQYLLCGLGVGHPTIDKIQSTAKEYGLPSKLTGAGGGGCVISLLPPGISAEKIAELEGKLQKMGFETLNCTVGQQGLRVFLSEERQCLSSL